MCFVSFGMAWIFRIGTKEKHHIFVGIQKVPVLLVCVHAWCTYKANFGFLVVDLLGLANMLFFKNILVAFILLTAIDICQGNKYHMMTKHIYPRFLFAIWYGCVAIYLGHPLS